jgi:hypothetical protein
MDEERQRLKLSEAARNVLEECRTVVPGVQGLFGFQLIAVFSEAFDKKLDTPERSMHLASLLLVVLSLVCIMTPAAYHRINGPREVTAGFITVASRLLLVSMAALAIAITLDTFLVARIVLGMPAGLWVAGAVLLLFGTLWFLFPHNAARRRALQRLGPLAPPDRV